MNDDALKQHFKFDEADLHYNRNGNLTDKQKTFLAGELKTSKQVWIYMGIFMLLVAIAPPIAQAYTLLTKPLSLWDAVMGVVCWGAWGFIWGGLGVLAIRDSFSPRKYLLQKVEGPANIVKVERSSSSSSASTRYELRVSGHKFDVDSVVADYIEQGEPTVVYYAEDSSSKASVTILSVERSGLPPQA